MLRFKYVYRNKIICNKHFTCQIVIVFPCDTFRAHYEHRFNFAQINQRDQTQFYVKLVNLLVHGYPYVDTMFSIFKLLEKLYFFFFVIIIFVAVCFFCCTFFFVANKNSFRKPWGFVVVVVDPRFNHEINGELKNLNGISILYTNIIIFLSFSVFFLFNLIEAFICNAIKKQ